MADIDIDLNTAHVRFSYVDLGDGCVGRRYFWCHADDRPGWIWDDELRGKHPEISDDVTPACRENHGPRRRASVHGVRLCCLLPT